MEVKMVQKHLTYEEMTNLGCFYTPERYVNALIDMVKEKVPDYKRYNYVDTSCGYGAFLNKLIDCKTIGCDIDKKALDIARKNNINSIYYNLNSLCNFDRSKIQLNENSPLIIIGNPPYNDTTSKVKNGIKSAEPCFVDEDLKTRDLGISFILSYNKIKADYVAILHPLSYMIKKSNYQLLSPFFQNYILIDHKIINSQAFGLTSKSSGFPIIIALYERNARGLTYNELENKNWKTIEGHEFNIKINSIKNYISKYPSKYKTPTGNDILFFTMRDINALKRNKTFIKEYCDNAIIVDSSKLALYCYVDVFKDYIDHIPYYLGNCDVFINYDSFIDLKNIFITKSLEKHPFLEKFLPDGFQKNKDYFLINQYFIDLLGENYVY